MNAVNVVAVAPSIEHLEAKLQTAVEQGALHWIEGILQRADYQRKQFSVVAQCQVWRFALAPDCQLWFDDRPAILRCFHPLDRVQVIFADGEPGPQVKAMYAWEQKGM
jgi:hypothetical protein